MGDAAGPGLHGAPVGDEVDLRRRTSRLLRRLSLGVHRYAARAARSSGMSTTDMQAMGVLVTEGEPLAASRVGRHLGLSRPAVSAMLDRLEQDGYVRRSGSSDDGRRVLVHATARARLESAARFEEMNRVVQEVLDAYPDQAEAFLVVLDALTEAVEGLDVP